jgi:hypothetical protein
MEIRNLETVYAECDDCSTKANFALCQRHYESSMRESFDDGYAKGREDALKEVEPPKPQEA